MSRRSGPRRYAPGTPPAAFHDLPAAAFPLTLELIDKASREVKWSVNLPGPGAVHVPSKHDINEGRPMIARAVFATGERYEEG